MAFRSVGVAAAMYQNQLNQLARMEKNKRGNTPPNLTNGAIPKWKTKGPIINALVPLIRQVTDNIDLQYFLISLYDDTSNDQYTIDLFSGQTHEQARAIIQKHVEMFSDTFYRGSAPELSFDLTNDENVVNLAYIMYLDMRHDETIDKSLRFDDFCKEEINVKVKVKNVKNLANRSQKSPVFILFGKAIKPIETFFIKRIRGFGGEGDNAELAIKNNLPSIHLKPDGTSYLPIYKEINRDQITNNILKEGHNLFMGIDQEDEKATVTLNIEKTKYGYTKNNGKTLGTAKIFYPLISVANLMDPGKNMLIESAKENAKYLMKAMGTEYLSRLTWNYKQPKFTFKMSHGITVLSTSYRDEVKTGNGNKRKRGYEYTINNPNSNDNERILSSTMSKGKAKVGTTNDRVAKFMGDFMQALTMVAHIKNNTYAKRNYCLATGDAMLCNSFIFMCSISGTTPNLWMPISKQQTSLVYGGMLNNFNPYSNIKSAPTEVRNANNRRTPSIVSGVGSSGGSTLGGNNINNEIQSANRGRTTLNQRLRAKGLNNNIRSALLKKYNERTLNVNGVIAKANAIVLNKKRAENKKILNQRLREKGLNNNTRIALLKTYNEGTLNFNGVIAKANQIINNKRSNPAEMSGQGMKRQRNNTENNLRQRLTNKGLQKYIITGLIQGYKSGNMSFNEVLNESNKILRTAQAANAEQQRRQREKKTQKELQRLDAQQIQGPRRSARGKP